MLDEYGTISIRMRCIAYDKQELLRDAHGKPLSRWDGMTKKLHPITGEEMPDPDAKYRLYSYLNPRPAPWPEADFIVGNPPFIGGKDMRHELGDGYAEACWKARPQLPGGADFVMHFWDEAATRLLRKGTAKAAESIAPLRLHHHQFHHADIFAPRHRASHGGQGTAIADLRRARSPVAERRRQGRVRIAMTVAEKGDKQGALAEVVSESEFEYRHARL